MGTGLGVLFNSSKRRRTKKISKLKTLLSLAVSRVGILKNQHQARCSIAHGDIARLLHLGHSDRALLLADTVLKEENMLDVFALIQSYCHLLSERASLIQHQRDCPDELKEAVSSLIYASTRSGEMPELQHVCRLFSSMYGREFVNAATELRNNCRVNSKIVQKLSTRQPSLENRVRIIKEIAAEKGITLELVYEDPYAPTPTETIPTQNKKQSQPSVGADLGLDSTSGRSVPNYRDVASAAQAAFEKAADAAAAARAAVELSRLSHSSDSDDDDHNSRKIENQIQEDWSEEEEEPVLYSDKQRGMSVVSSGFNSDSAEAPLREKKLNEFGSWGSIKSKDKKNETESDKEYLRDSLMNPLNQKRNPVSKYKENSDSSVYGESDVSGLLKSEDEQNFTSYSAETTSPENYTRKAPLQQTKVTRRAVSVRTRRGMNK